ncbi:MAG TPA: RNA-binding cell elongation regulator Jag/EloR [Candidatus Limnocylindrales bacterium]
MNAYREFTGKTVEEALRTAREAFGVGLDDLDFEILTQGSRGVLGMGAEAARIIAAPRAELGGAAPKREAAASQPLPPPPPREARPFGDGDRGRGRGGFQDDRGGRGRGPDRGPDRGPSRGPDRGPRVESGPRADAGPRGEAVPRRDDGPFPREDRGPRRPDRPDRPDAPPRRNGGGAPWQGRPPREAGFDRREDRGARYGDAPRRAPETDLSASDVAELTAARGSLAAERSDLEAAEASPEALAAGQEILSTLMSHLGFDVRVEVETGDTSRLNVVGDGEEKDALGALIGRKGERLSALQHLVNLMLSKKMGGWTRVLVDVEDYRGRRERQLRDIAMRAAGRVVETGKMLQLEPMPALERRWIHIALRDHPDVITQSIGEEPNRRIVVLPRPN